MSPVKIYSDTEIMEAIKAGNITPAIQDQMEYDIQLAEKKRMFELRKKKQKGEENQ